VDPADNLTSHYSSSPDGIIGGLDLCESCS